MSCLKSSIIGIYLLNISFLEFNLRGVFKMQGAEEGYGDMTREASKRENRKQMAGGSLK